MIQKIDSHITKLLFQPKPTSHKGDNGKVLIIGGSQKFHGASLLAAKIASKIVDLVYFCSVPENNELIKKMKEGLCEFITLEQSEVESYVEKVDAILIGPGMGVTPETQEIVNQLLSKFPQQKFILDADALKMVEKQLLTSNIIVTPHAKEFEFLFEVKPSAENVLKMAQKYHCVVVLKGQTDYVSDGKKLKSNTTGNAGMTKGGTGDVLAGLITGLASKNDLFLSACAGVYVNGQAGDNLQKRVSYYYNASDLITEIPNILKR